MRYFDFCDCFPGRAGYLGIQRDYRETRGMSPDEYLSQSRETRPANPYTYGNITRSTVPRFRSRFLYDIS